jgi:hypothetical protein
MVSHAMLDDLEAEGLLPPHHFSYWHVPREELVPRPLPTNKCSSLISLNEGLAFPYVTLCASFCVGMVSNSITCPPTPFLDWRALRPFVKAT